MIRLRNDLKKLPISEIFESFQGEGRYMGQRALFIRFAGCNLAGKCKDCDTDYSFREWWTVESLAKKIYEYYLDGGKLVVYTGGEPMLYQEYLIKIMDKVVDYTYDVDFQVETNGTIRPTEEFLRWVDRVVVSPKKGYHNEAIRNYTRTLWGRKIVDWKFVVGDVPKGSVFWGYDEVKEVVERMISQYKIKKRNVWLMPYGATKEEIEKNAVKVWELARELGVNYSDRLHIRIYGGERRGV